MPTDTTPRQRARRSAALLHPPLAMPEEGQVRAVIDAVLPQIDGGRFAVKRVVGEALAVTAHVFTDGHDQVRARLCWRREGDTAWQEAEMLAQGNDVWGASCTPDAQGRWCLTPSGRDRSLHLLAAAKAHEGDLLSRWSYDEGALLKLQLQKFIAATNPGLTDLWHEA